MIYIERSEKMIYIERDVCMFQEKRFYGILLTGKDTIIEIVVYI